MSEITKPAAQPSLARSPLLFLVPYAPAVQFFGGASRPTGAGPAKHAGLARTLQCFDSDYNTKCYCAGIVSCLHFLKINKYVIERSTLKIK